MCCAGAMEVRRLFLSAVPEAERRNLLCKGRHVADSAPLLYFVWESIYMWILWGLADRPLLSRKPYLTCVWVQPTSRALACARVRKQQRVRSKSKSSFTEETATNGSGTPAAAVATPSADTADTPPPPPPPPPQGPGSSTSPVAAVAAAESQESLAMQTSPRGATSRSDTTLHPPIGASASVLVAADTGIGTSSNGDGGHTADESFEAPMQQPSALSYFERLGGQAGSGDGEVNGDGGGGGGGKSRRRRKPEEVQFFFVWTPILQE
ncbi:unnamed protein product [Pylaiella littoralis]